MIQYDTIQDSPFPIARPDSKFQPVPCTQIASQKKHGGNMRQPDQCIQHNHACVRKKVGNAILPTRSLT